MIKIIKKIPICLCEKKVYTSAIYSGNSYKMLSPCEKKVDIYTCKLNKMCSKNLCEPYYLITNSKCKDEYYVVKENDYENIYLIDCKYNEISKIRLNIPIKYKKKIVSISYDYEKYKIYIAISNMVYSVTVEGDFIKDEITPVALDKMKFTKTQKNYGCCTPYSPSMINITSIGFICGNLCVAYLKNDSSYIMFLSNLGDILENVFVDDDVVVTSVFLNKGRLELLMTKNLECNYIYITDYCCNYKKNPCSCEIFNSCECRVDCECEKPKENKCCKSDLCDIIESIALIETSLSHVLNAEGEKIQKAVKIACNCEDLIKVNESVSRTITNVTMLETVLADKLKMAIDYVSEETKKCK